MANGRKIALAWADLLLLVVLVVAGTGIGVFIEEAVDRELKSSEPREEVFQQSEGVPLRQAELATAQSRLKALQDKLVEQRVALDQQSAKVEALTAATPKLSGLPLTASRAAGVTRQVFTEFHGARIDLETRTRLVMSLSDQLDQATRDVAQRVAGATKAQLAATRQFNTAKHDFQVRKRTRTLALAAGAVSLFLVVTWVVIGIVQRLARSPREEETPFAPSIGATFLLATALLSVLISYQAFQLPGAAAACVVLVIVLFVLLARPSRSIAV